MTEQTAKGPEQEVKSRMIITRTPFRISFFGGGTDYPAWYAVNGGHELSTTIDKYCYLSCRYLPPFFEYRYRIVYSKTENVQEIAQIQHPSVRECLRFLRVQEGVAIHHDGDLPARSGMGSSSAFMVDLLHALYVLSGKVVDKQLLAQIAIHIEQDLMKENIGSQDQVSAVVGGFNLIEFGGAEGFSVKPITISETRRDYLIAHLMLFFTGVTRIASHVVADQIRLIPKTATELKAIEALVGEALNVLSSTTDLTEFGHLFHEHWKLKKKLSSRVTTREIDQIYSTARSAGTCPGDAFDSFIRSLRVRKISAVK